MHRRKIEHDTYIAKMQPVWAKEQEDKGYLMLANCLLQTMLPQLPELEQILLKDKKKLAQKDLLHIITIIKMILPCKCKLLS